MKLYILISLVLLSMTMVSSQEIQISQSNNVIDRIVNMDLPTAKDFNNNTDNVNSSDFWDNLDTTNTTQFENNGGVLNILESWLTTFFNSLFSGKTTDDLTEGTTNLYDNQSWNQFLADTLYIKNNTSGWTLNFTKIFSDNWSNVTITESQISDLSHTPQTSDGSLNSTAWNRTIGNVFLANPSDKVGIGTVSPTDELNVVGNVNITQNLTMGNFKFYEDANGHLIIKGI